MSIYKMPKASEVEQLAKELNIKKRESAEQVLSKTILDSLAEPPSMGYIRVDTPESLIDNLSLEFKEMFKQQGYKLFKVVILGKSSLAVVFDSEGISRLNNYSGVTEII